jgi:hypothetical protein
MFITPPAAPLQPKTKPWRLSFRFLTQTPSPPHASRPHDPPPPSPGMCHRATPTHHPPLLFHTACPKLSHHGTVLGILTQTPPHLLIRDHMMPPPQPPCTHHHPCAHTTTPAHTQPPLRTHNHPATSSHHPSAVWHTPN